MLSNSQFDSRILVIQARWIIIGQRLSCDIRRFSIIQELVLVVPIFFKFINLRRYLARLCYYRNNLDGFGLEDSWCHARARFGVCNVRMDLIDWSTTSIGLPCFTSISARRIRIEMISRVYFLGHLEVWFTPVYSTLSSSLLDNIFLKTFLWIFILRPVLIKTSTIRELIRNMWIWLYFTNRQLKLLSSTFDVLLLRSEILMEGNKCSEITDTCSFLNFNSRTYLIGWLVHLTHTLCGRFSFISTNLGIASVLII